MKSLVYDASSNSAVRQGEGRWGDCREVDTTIDEWRKVLLTVLITVTVVGTQLYSHTLPKVHVLLVTHTDREGGRRGRWRERKRIKHDNWT